MSGFLNVLSRVAHRYLNGYAEGRALGHRNHGDSAIERLCSELRWPIEERQGNTFHLDLLGKSGTEWRVSIMEERAFVRFIVTSSLSLPPEKAPPVLAYLLTRNLSMPFGGWISANTEDDRVLIAVSYRAPALGLTADFMNLLCESLIAEVEEFEESTQS